VRPSSKVTVILLAPSTTWLLVTIIPSSSRIHPEPAPCWVNGRLKKSKVTTSVVMATTEGLTWATTSAILGSTMLWFAVGVGGGGGVQVGLIGSGGGAGGGGGGAGLGEGAGETSMYGTAHPVPSISESMRMRKITKYVILFMANFILAHGHN